MEAVWRKIIGVWSVTSSLVKEEASQIVDEAMNAGIEAYYQTHQNWWNIFYSRSSLTLPDKVIEKQYYNEIYKMGVSEKTRIRYLYSLCGQLTMGNYLLGKVIIITI